MNLTCPECGGEMSFNGYRPLFPECRECGETIHIDECKAKEDSE